MLLMMTRITRNTLPLFSTLCIVSLFSGCGSSYDIQGLGGSSRGTGAEIGFGSDAEVQPLDNADIVSIIAPISTINGNIITANATPILIDEQESEFLDFVKPGMLLSLAGHIVGSDGTIRAENGTGNIYAQLTGEITQITEPFLNAVTYTVNGYDVSTTALTFAPESLMIGDRIKAYGIGDLRQEFIATRIEKVESDDSPDFILAKVTAYDNDNNLLTVGNVVYNLANTSLENWPESNRQQDTLIYIINTDGAITEPDEITYVGDLINVASEEVLFYGLVHQVDNNTGTTIINDQQFTFNTSDTAITSALLENNIVGMQAMVSDGAYSISQIATTYSPSVSIITGEVQAGWVFSSPLQPLFVDNETIVIDEFTSLTTSLLTQGGLSMNDNVSVAGYMNEDSFVAVKVELIE